MRRDGQTAPSVALNLGRSSGSVMVPCMYVVCTIMIIVVVDRCSIQIDQYIGFDPGPRPSHYASGGSKVWSMDRMLPWATLSGWVKQLIWESTGGVGCRLTRALLFFTKDSNPGEHQQCRSLNIVMQSADAGTMDVVQLVGPPFPNDIILRVLSVSVTCSIQPQFQERNSRTN